MFDKIIVITRKTRLQELIARFNTRGQARFYIEHAGGSFEQYEQEDLAYRAALEMISRQLSSVDLSVQYIDREFLPNFVFSAQDIVLVVGQDGLVANAAKYVGEQPIVGINPDPAVFSALKRPYNRACSIFPVSAQGSPARPSSSSARSTRRRSSAPGASPCWRRRL